MSQYDDGGWSILLRARELAEAGETCALATVVWRQGPSSGHHGSRALVRADGTLEGWIGGACAEPVVLREARSVIADHEPKLLYLGTSPDVAVPDGARFVAMSCQSEGALQIFIEPVLPVVDLVIVGRSPMTTMLATLAGDLGWKVTPVDAETPAALSSTALGRRSVVVVATQGHHDEEAVRWAAESGAAFVGLVASHRRGEAVLGYLRDRGVAAGALDRVHTPVGLDLGHTTHAEIAVAILAELVRLRAAGGLRPRVDLAGDAGGEASLVQEAVDPVCHMTVAADDSHWPLTLPDQSGRPDRGAGGTTYWFCCAGCRSRFEKDPATYLQGV